jgi:hypothetical protein
VLVQLSSMLLAAPLPSLVSQRARRRCSIAIDSAAAAVAAAVAAASLLLQPSS